MDYEDHKYASIYDGDDEGDSRRRGRRPTDQLPRPGPGRQLRVRQDNFSKSWHGVMPASPRSQLSSATPDYMRTSLHVPSTGTRTPLRAVVSDAALGHTHSPSLGDGRRASLPGDGQFASLPADGGEHRDLEKSGFLEKFRVHMLTRTRKGTQKFYFHLSRTYFRYSESITATEPKRIEVRSKIVRVLSTKGSGFDVCFRNGHVWHLAADNLVDKIEWMEALIPGSFPARARASIISVDGIEGPGMPDQADNEPAQGVKASNSSGGLRSLLLAATIGVSSLSSSPVAQQDPVVTAPPDPPPANHRRPSLPDTPPSRQHSPLPLVPPGQNYSFSTLNDKYDNLSMDSDTDDLLDAILDSVDAMNIDKRAPPPLPECAGAEVEVRKPLQLCSLAINDYMTPQDDSIPDYVGANYEEHTSAGMAGDALVEIKHYAVGKKRAASTLSMGSIMTQDSEKFLRVAQSKKDVLTEQLRATAKMIPLGEIEIRKVIGKGAFGAVHVADWSFRSGCATIEVAVKSLQESSDERAEKDFLAEAMIMAEFDHANIIRLFGVIDDGKTPRIVTEYMQNGSLKDFLVHVRMCEPELRTLPQLIQYIIDISAGLQYLAEEGFVHRDLAARNVLVAEDERCKITDFGLSRKLEDDTSEYVSTGGLLPLKWTAPEAGMEKCFTTSSDVWSLGVTMWEVMTYGKKPYASLSFFNLFPQLQRGVRLGKPRDCPDDLYDVMKSCWEWEREDRPTCEQICTQVQGIMHHALQDLDDDDSPCMSSVS